MRTGGSRLSIAIRHRDAIEQIDGLHQQLAGGDREPRILHARRIARPLLAEALHEREHVLAHHLEHVLRREVCEARPAQIAERARAAAGVIHPLRENRILNRDAQGAGLVLGERLQLIKALNEQEVR